VLVSGVALLFLSPLFLVVAALIKLEDREGPVFFTQVRVGKWGREFPFPKFRSMVSNAEALKNRLLEENQHGGEGVTFKMKRDPRITRVGRVIRRFSIDELPQLWSVFIGDMSLVGPRPAVPREVAQYTFADRRRLNAAPGLTCIWQVSGRAEIPFDQQVELDEQYIQSRSLKQDLRLLLLTVPAVLTGRGAY
jgi:lipopolysaccharide/colanic/teichoic acid biosynthesis glycosyltransferase